MQRINIKVPAVKQTNIPKPDVHMVKSMIIAVDFDGVLSLEGYPAEGSPNRGLIREINTRKKKGDRFILWTCRSGEELERAVDFCKKNGLEFDAVNENLPDIKREKGDSRKVFANEYWDDKCTRIVQGTWVN